MARSKKSKKIEEVETPVEVVETQEEVVETQEEVVETQEEVQVEVIETPVEEVVETVEEEEVVETPVEEVVETPAQALTAIKEKVGFRKAVVVLRIIAKKDNVAPALGTTHALTSNIALGTGNGGMTRINAASKFIGRGVVITLEDTSKMVVDTKHVFLTGGKNICACELVEGSTIDTAIGTTTVVKTETTELDKAFYSFDTDEAYVSLNGVKHVSGGISNKTKVDTFILA